MFDKTQSPLNTEQTRIIVEQPGDFHIHVCRHGVSRRYCLNHDEYERKLRVAREDFMQQRTRVANEMIDERYGEAFE